MRGVRVAVWGLGRQGGGVGVTRWLAGQGARVAVVDRASPATLSESLAAIADLPVELCLGREDEAVLLSQELVIINPAIDPKHNPFLFKLLESGRPWTTEINLFLDRCPARVVGVTGSFGKSTTSAMIHAILEAHFAAKGSNEELLSYGRGSAGSERGSRAWLGGNIGTSLLPALNKIQEDDIVVLELSSAQLELLHPATRRPDLAVLTNLHPHHLDRHGTLDQYARAKLAILGVDFLSQPTLGERFAPSSPCSTRCAAGAAPARNAAGANAAEFFGGEWRGIAAQAVLVLGEVVPTAQLPFLNATTRLGHRLRTLQPIERLASDFKFETRLPFEIKLPGEHNRKNAALAIAVAKELGILDGVIKAGLSSFPGLSHRLEFVAEIGGTHYWNDSKATSPGGLPLAIRALGHAEVVIVGGSPIDEPFGEAAKAMEKSARVVICMAATGSAWAGELSRLALPPKVIIVVERVEEAVAYAREIARKGENVLFCPCSPSFDQFSNFQERGAAFKTAVRRLANG